jgi:cobalt-precorrin-5B (C1)-methyltransferase
MGPRIVTEVELRETPGIEIRGGPGVATVTKPGWDWKSGPPPSTRSPAGTSPREEELSGSPYRGAVVTIAVPGGEDMAKKTTNARLGLLGGISILGTTGIVPYSTAAWRASVVQEIDVAAAAGERMLVLTTGGKSEQYAMALYPELPEAAFIQVGDFIGVGVRHCARRKIQRTVVVGMMGKLSKMAKGKMQTHAAGSEVDMGFLASLAPEMGGSAALLEDIRAANTARHVLDLCREAGLIGITTLVAARSRSTAPAMRAGDWRYGRASWISEVVCSGVTRRRFHERRAGGILSSISKQDSSWIVSGSDCKVR